MAAAKSDFNCGSGIFPVVRRKGGKSVYRVEKRKRRESFALDYIACLPPHIVINEVMINPTWNRGYVASLQRGKS